MTIQLVQTAQVSGITNLGQMQSSFYLPSIVINPTLPAFIFNYTSSYYYVGVVVIGNRIQFLNYDSTDYYGAIIAFHNPILFFENSVLSPLLYEQVSSSGVTFVTDPSIGVYNIITNTFVWTSNIFPQNLIFNLWKDAYIDFQNQFLYLLGTTLNGSALFLLAIPFSELPTLLNNLQLSQNFKEASPIAPDGYAPSHLIMIYYNNTFYIVFMDSNNNIDLWVFGVNELDWISTMPSFTTNFLPTNAKTVGSVTTIFNTSYGGYDFSASFHYSMNNGNINPEILISVCWSSTETYLTVISIDPDTLSSSTIASFNNYNAYPPYITSFYSPIYITGGLLIANAQVSQGGTPLPWYIFVYDMNTGEYTVFPNTYPPPSDLLYAILADGGYYITVTGSSNNATITVYQVVSDSSPVITNVKFNQNNTITGTAMDLVSNTPASGVVVALFQLESQGGYEFAGEIIATTTTDSNGDFSFQVSQPGYYAIRAFT